MVGEIEEQLAEWMDIRSENLIASRGYGNPWYILGAHYDTRLVADRDHGSDGRSYSSGSGSK